MFSAAKSGTVPSAFTVNNSLRFRASASAYLNRTPASAGSRTTWTVSFWAKLGALTGTTNLFCAGPAGVETELRYGYNTTSTFSFSVNGTTTFIATTALYRDPSAWYHIVVVADTTNATSTERFKLYINNTLQTFTTATQPSQNTAMSWNNNVLHYIGRRVGASDYYDGYISEFYSIDGQALTPSSFGSTNATTGVWQPAKYTGTYGTNGFYLNFNSIALTSGSNTGLGKDNSGNGNYFNTNNISVTAGTTYDAMTDVPTLTSATAANYSVLNPIDSSGKVIAGANLNFSGTANGIVKASIGMSSGKWYCEVTNNAANDTMLGICTQSTAPTIAYLGTNTTSWSYRSGGTKFTNATSSAYGSSYTTNDIIGIAFDADAGSLTFYKNNVSQGVAFSSLAANTYVFAAGNNAATNDCSFNFGQRPFTYTPPSGYVALNTYNLPDSTVVKGNSYMDATLYTGNNTGQTITNAGAFKPDLVWVKVRSTSYSNTLVNSVMGLGNALFSDTTGAVTATSEYTSFNANGFTLGATGSTASNVSGATYVAWQWQAGQSSGASNTSGSITSTVSVSATAGFSVVTYTGTGANATVGHGLGVAPKMVIIKRRSAVESWVVYHANLTSAAYRLVLNGTNAEGSVPAVFNSTAPTSSVFSIGTDTSTNGSATTYVAYCWSEIAGFSKFGSYTGNSSTNGTFVYTGFRPKFILIKRSSAIESWIIIDTSRDTYNVAFKRLIPNSSSAENTADTTTVDILSNGFKLRSVDTATNSSGTYIYAAFAENPFKNANAR